MQMDGDTSAFVGTTPPPNDLSLFRAIHERCSFEHVKSLLELTQMPLEKTQSKSKPEAIGILFGPMVPIDLTHATAKEVNAWIAAKHPPLVRLLFRLRIFFALSPVVLESDFAKFYEFLSEVVRLDSHDQLLLLSFLYQKRYHNYYYYPSLEILDDGIKRILSAIYSKPMDEIDQTTVPIFNFNTLSTSLLFYALYHGDYFNVGLPRKTLIYAIMTDRPGVYNESKLVDALNSIYESGWEVLNSKFLTNVDSPESKVLFESPYVDLLVLVVAVERTDWIKPYALSCLDHNIEKEKVADVYDAILELRLDLFFTLLQFRDDDDSSAVDLRLAEIPFLFPSAETADECRTDPQKLREMTSAFVRRYQVDYFLGLIIFERLIRNKV